MNYSPKEYLWHQQRKMVYALFQNEETGRIIKTEFEPVKDWKEIFNEYNLNTRIVKRKYERDGAYRPRYPRQTGSSTKLSNPPLGSKLSVLKSKLCKILVQQASAIRSAIAQRGVELRKPFSQDEKFNL